MRLLIAVLILTFAGFSPAQAASEKESAFDRILRTGTLRCGYVIAPPYVNKDPNTGNLSGIIYDITEKAGEQMGFDVDWAEEVTYGTMYEGLKTGRYDALCIQGWDVAKNAMHVRSSVPLFYNVLYAYTRTGDARFDNNMDAVNSPDVNITAVEGTMLHIIARENFPRANLLSMPQMTDYSFNTQNLISGKSDITVEDAAYMADYMAKNPGKIRRVKTDKPLRYYPVSLQVGIREHELAAMLDSTLTELKGNGHVARILENYQTDPPSIYLPAVPYRMPVDR